MDSHLAVKRLSALAQQSRLDVFRLLVRAGRPGLAAGVVADALAVSPNTLSAQLNVLTEAGLIVRRREGRSIIYGANFDAMGDLLVYLVEDCCQGKPETCDPLIKAMNRAACC